jgi:hypothetical protein
MVLLRLASRKAASSASGSLGLGRKLYAASSAAAAAAPDAAAASICSFTESVGCSSTSVFRFHLVVLC